MKKNALLILAALMLSAGCDAYEPLPGASPLGDEAFVSLRLTMNSGKINTRAFGDDITVDEDAIHDGVILEFNQDGLLLEMVEFTGDVLPTLQVRKYEQTRIYVVANPTVDLSGISTLSEFLSTQSDYQANSFEKMEMTGVIEGTFDTDSTVVIKMKRMLSKILVRKMIFRCAINDPTNYTGMHLTRGNMVRTPVSCSYDLTLSGNYLDAFARSIPIGYTSHYISGVNRYDQGGFKVWEYEKPWAVYCYPNASENQYERNRLAINYRLIYQVTGIDASTGEHVTLTRYDDATVYMILPPLLPNTLYELERLTLTGYRNGIVILGVDRGIEEEPATCTFRMKDLTSGEYLGTIQGEVEYEILDS